MEMIARIHSEFPTKFGIPRQSCMAEHLQAAIVFEPGYREPEALRGLEEFSHIWLIWQFSENVGYKWTPTVRPPRLGGNIRKGVFATRSPFRPNPIGLSCVKLERICKDEALGFVLNVSGADLMDGTPIYDIKPYLPHVDSHPEAKGGFSDMHKDYKLEINFPEEWIQKIPQCLRNGIVEVLALDPRPSYQKDPRRIYGFQFAGYEIKFSVTGTLLTVCEVINLEENDEI